MKNRFKKPLAKPYKKTLVNHVPEVKKNLLKDFFAYSVFDSIPEFGSRISDYWSGKRIKEFHDQTGSRTKIPKKFLSDPNTHKIIASKFSLKGFQYGKWVTMEDRVNYLLIIYICLTDLQSILKFKGNNLGINKTLALAFGARGRSGALAHYEPFFNIINLTRYKDYLKGDSNRTQSRYLRSGGVGTFAHEYGHFLDFHFGMKAEPRIGREVCLSGVPSSESKSLIYQDEKRTGKNELRKQMDLILHTIFFQKGQKTAYHKRLKELIGSGYYHRRCEVFARAFELYISLKMKEKGFSNKFLAQKNYDTRMYMTAKEMKSITPMIDKLIKGMRTYF